MPAAVTHVDAGKLRLALAVGAVVVLLLLAYAFRFILLAGVIGVVLGVILAPLVCWLQRRARLPHGVSVLLTAVAVVGLLAGLGYAIVALLGKELNQLFEQGPGIVERLQSMGARWLGQLGGGSLQQIDWGGLMQQSAKALLGGVKTGAEAVGAVVVVLAIGIFVSANPDGYLRGLLSVLRPARRPEAERLAHGAASVVRSWLVSQLVVVLISGVLTAVAMGLIGIDYWLLIALLTVVLDFIPLFGALLTGGIAVLLTLGTEPEKVWWVLLAYVAIQQIETDVTLPYVMKRRIRLPEVPLLLFVLMMGVAFGVAGIFVATPVFAVLHHVYLHAYLPRIEGRPVAPD